LGYIGDVIELPIARRNSVRLLVGLGFLALFLTGADPAFAKIKRIANGQSLVVMTRAGSDNVGFRKRLQKRGLVINREIRCKKDKWSIFEVVPSSGTVRAALQLIVGSPDVDLEAADITFRIKPQQCVPQINDPAYAGQIGLANMHHGEMRCLLDAKGMAQVVQPRITVIDSGCEPIPGEMTQIQQFRFVGDDNGISETTHDVDVHGTAVTSVAAAGTNNGAFIAGVSSHTNSNVKITMLRVYPTPDPGNPNQEISTVDVLDALRWCVDNQAVRGGPGVINLSIQSFGLPQGLPTMNGSPVVQAIAKSLLKQDDLLVNAAGNDGLVDPSKEKNLRRVAGLEADNSRWPSSNFGKFKGAALGVMVSAFSHVTDTVQFGTGTSYAAPQWSGAVALLMSLDPQQKLTAPKADKILEKTGTKTPDGFVIPNLEAAVIKAFKIKP